MRYQGLFIQLMQSLVAQRTAVVLTIILFIVFFIQGIGKIMRPEGNDFTSYLQASTYLLNGENIYQQEMYFPPYYPLFLAFAVSPLIIFPNTVAFVIWYGCSIAALLWVIKLLLTSYPNQQRSLNLSFPTFFVLLIYIPIIQNNLLNGQVNFFVLLLSLFFLIYFEAQKPFPSAIFLGMAISLKIVPALFLILLFIRKSWKTFFWTLIATVFFFILPVICLGDGIFTSYHDFFFHKLAPWLTEQEVPHPQNSQFSLNGFLVTLWPSHLDNVWIKCISVLLMFSILFTIDCINTHPKSIRWSFSLYWLAILLISPLSETHHLIFTLPAFVLLLRQIIFSEHSNSPIVFVGLLGFIMVYYLAHFTDLNAFLFLAIAILFGANVFILFDQKQIHIEHETKDEN